MPPKASSPQTRTASRTPAVDLLTLQWGEDQLFIQDRAWCDVIVAEATPQREYYPAPYREQFSREEVELAQAGFGDLEEASSRPKGLTKPAPGPVARSCLKALFGLELPAALLLTDLRTPTGVIAQQAWLEVLYSSSSSFQVALAFSGLKLYADGRIGDPESYLRVMPGTAVQRRALDNRWWHVRLDGHTQMAVKESPSRFAPRRVFWLEDGWLFDSEGNALREVAL